MEKHTSIKEQLVSKSLDYFQKYGSREITMDDLASHFGISKKTLYNYFKSKEYLVTACVTHMWSHFDSQIHEILSLKVHPLLKIIYIYDLGIQELRKVDAQFLLSIKRYFPEAMEQYETLRKKLIHETVLGLLKEAVANKAVFSFIDLKLFCELNLENFDLNLYQFQLFERFSNDAILEHTIVSKLRGITCNNYLYLYD